uniref:Ferredoxin--NADP reductase n=1 Tax=Lygus hesperus TaxID=30085 RepID=A0A0A9Z5G7_LYGHE
MMGLRVELKYPIQKSVTTTTSGASHSQAAVITYHKKNGSQHKINVPIMMPNVLAALCSRFILIMFLSLVGVECKPTSFNAKALLDPPDEPSVSPLQSLLYFSSRHHNTTTTYFTN